MTVDALLASLADLVADRVLERLQAGRGEPDVYSSDALPPDCPSRARFHVLVKGMPGAERRGRRWFVSAETWRGARVARRASGGSAVPDEVDAAIEAAGFRSTR